MKNSKTKCNYLGCDKAATTKVVANDGTENEYPVCPDHQDQMNITTVAYKSK